MLGRRSEEEGSALAVAFDFWQAEAGLVMFSSLSLLLLLIATDAWFC